MSVATAQSRPAPTVTSGAGGAGEEGRAALLAGIERVKRLLEAHRDGGGGVVDEPAAAEPAAIEPARAPGPLRRIGQRLGLSPFEEDVLLLAAAVELDGEVAALVAALVVGTGGHGDPRPTLALAMAVLPAAHWDVVSPERPLRRWGLVELVGHGALVNRPVAVDEHLLHTLAGLPQRELGGLAVAAPGPTPLTPSQHDVADEVAAALSSLTGPLLLRLDGDDREAQLAICGRVAAALGLEVLLVRDAALGDGDLRRAATVLDREALVGDRLLVTSSERLLPLLDARVVAVLGGSLQPSTVRTCVSRTVGLPTGTEQVGLWLDALADALGDRAGDPALSAAAREVGHHYRLTARSIGAIAAELSALPHGTSDDLRGLARARARIGLGSLAERVEPRAHWEDLVLPAGQLALLRDIAAQVRHRSQVYDEWGFGCRPGRGFGVTAMFVGESGTGKTMAAEVIAADLGLDLYRIDLSAVVSKYIGETEKNLRQLFDAAESGGAVLLFDEADALFAKRSEVKDSHDRYANLEVAYLLQRMEGYRGLAVLTTNLRDNIDRAFLRRLRFVVQLPFPDREQRAEIWRRVFPPRTPTEELDPEALAELQVAGGSIHAIALAAAFGAAREGSPVRPEHVLRAAQVEYAKAERTLTDVETAALSRRSR